MQVQRCNVLVQVVGARNVPIREEREAQAAPPGSPKRRKGGYGSGSGSSGESDTERDRRGDGAVATEFLDETKLEYERRARTFVEVRFQEHVRRTFVCAGRSPLWKESLSMPFMPHGNDFWLEDWAAHSQRQREWAKFKQQANFAIERRFGEVLDRFRPNVVHTHSMVDISTRVWHAARARGIPIVHTLRDFDLLCAASSMYRETGPCAGRHLKCRVLTFAKQFDQCFQSTQKNSYRIWRGA